MADEQKWGIWPRLSKPLTLTVGIAIIVGAFLIISAAIYKDNCITAKSPLVNIEIGPAACKK
jgi:hypothetical protein